MEKLNRNTAKHATQYPERIIQFGEGNFLRGFADWIICQMNRKTDFRAGVAVVQPLPEGMVELLNEQDGLYHLNLQGIDKGAATDTIELIDVITRGINPYRQFEQYLSLAENPDMRFVISNTTEAGIAFNPSCRLNDRPAASYPGKLVQLLYHRFSVFGGDPAKGWIIFPCELIFHNGKELKECINRYIALWELGAEFQRWVDTACGVYSTLVDRIVPGYPKDSAGEITGRIGLDDKLLVKAEVFHLWVIEAPQWVAREFPASEAGLNVLFVADEAPYHQRKVTLLNGPHTVLSPIGYLSGLDTVRQCVEDETTGRYVHKVMYSELMPAVDLPPRELEQFARDVLCRFRNPYVNHFVTSIMLNSFAKYKTRNLPALKACLNRKGELPRGLTLGLAAIITYYKGGKRGEEPITPADDEAVLSLLARLWETNNPGYIARETLAAEFIWGEDLNKIPGLTGALATCLQSIREKGMLETVKALL
ncbi:MAG: tagaturonate reductase [Tannerellaceae bacterium]|nr:tagaturonate reductase [Tannerellaceae bacterium]